MTQAWIITTILAVITYYFLNQNPDKNFRIFLPSNLVAFYYLISFGAGVLFYTSSTYTRENFSAFSISTIGWIAILGLVSMKISANLMHKVRYSSPIDLNHNLVGFINFYQIFAYLIVGWYCRLKLISAGRFFHTSSIDYTAATNQSSFIVSTLATLPLIVVFSIYLKSKFYNSPLPVFFYLLFFTELIFQLATGSRQAFLGPLLGFLYLHYRFSHSKFRVPIQVRIIVGSILPVVFAYIGIYRSVMMDRGFGIISSLKYSFEVLFKSGVTQGLWEGFNSIFQRSTDVISFSMAASVPRASLSNVLHNPFTEIPYALIPRLIFPDKQDISSIGNSFGRSVGLVNGVDFHTSVNFPHILEGYLFAGYFGVIAVCFVSGLIYGYLDSIIETTDKHYLHCVYAASAISIFNSPAQILAHGLIGYVKYIFAIFLFLKICDAITQKLNLNKGA